jgi:D-proline reductase (dithiol) PrdB
VSLVSRHLEANGIATVILGSARDVVEHCGVARFLYLDFPLGNPCGKPYDKDMQLDIVRQAIGLFDTARSGRTTVKAQVSWDHDQSWREDFCRVDDSNREALRLKGEQRRQQQLQAKTSGKTRSPMIP